MSIAGLGAVVMVDVIVLTAWTCISPVTLSDDAQFVNGVGRVASNMCRLHNKSFLIILSLTKVFICTLGCYCSFITRNSSFVFAESKHIMFA
jgi:hypothetical protein